MVWQFIKKLTRLFGPPKKKKKKTKQATRVNFYYHSEMFLKCSFNHPKIFIVKCKA